MAKRKKLYGAAAAAHARKMGKRSNPHKRRKRRNPHRSYRRRRRNPPPPPVASKSRRGRKRHMVKHYTRKGGSVSGYRRRGGPVKAHWSNPFGSAGGVALEGLIAAGAILGTLIAVGYANGQLQKVSFTQSGWGNLAGKLAVAVGAGMAAVYLARRRTISREVAFAMAGAAMAPLLLGGVAMVAPSVAGQVTLAGDGMEDNGMPPMAGVVEQGAVGAQLEAQLQAELQAELNDEVENGEI